MSQPPDPAAGDDAGPSVRPRPSWGQPAPTQPIPELDPSAALESLAHGRPNQPPPYVQDPYAAPAAGQGWGQPSAGQPSAGQPSGSQPGWGQPSGSQPSGGQPGWGAQPAASPYGQDLRQREDAYAHLYAERPRTGLAIASLVLGILSLLFCWFPVASYGAVIGALLAVIFGAIGVRRTSGRGMAIAGLSLGTIALLAAVAFSIFYTRFFVDAAGMAQTCAEEHPGLGIAYDRCITEGTEDLIPFG